MNNDEAATILEGIASLLESGGENGYASLVRDALSGSQQKLEEFLRSNTPWGGSGSIADSSFPGSTGRSAQRRELEKLLIQLAGCRPTKSLKCPYGRLYVQNAADGVILNV